jgi:hypothetical protein
VISVPLFLLGAGHFIGTLLRAFERVHDPAVENRIGWVLLGSAAFVVCALPDLLRLNRYERRAAARRDRGIRRLMQGED